MTQRGYSFEIVGGRAKDKLYQGERQYIARRMIDPLQNNGHAVRGATQTHQDRATDQMNQRPDQAGDDQTGSQQHVRGFRVIQKLRGVIENCHRIASRLEDGNPHKLTACAKR